MSHKFPYLSVGLSFLAAAALLLSSCSKSAAPPATTNPDLAPIEDALKAKDYDKAVTALLDYQQRQDLTPEQKAAAAREMSKVQMAVAEAAAQGDTKAQEAGNKLRAAAPH